MSLLYNHSKELNDTLNEFKEDTSNTDWILFGYKGDDLTLVSSGSNGLEEIRGEFEEECVQYALLKIFDETSKMLKFLYIAWCGEYAPPSQKANFSQHSQIFENFFKGYHMKINASCYEDVEPKNIISKVQNSSFFNFSSKYAPVLLKEKPVFNLPNKQETTPTPTTSAPAPVSDPRPNLFPPRNNPLFPRANPLSPKNNIIISKPIPIVPNSPLNPKYTPNGIIFF
ncbi:actin depolymerizing protein [Neocallimastix californiae]|uniref:Actin depolymerizing protein n=1 Tax=Neocallimastix californiae TaxID=1754190 RepID=A0A1Y2FKS1_9FUNG|nr:actin depolymerizing protein [Neocallimastix californiae]|eukprot:ORY84519.1 actin depolymerizing protein [Neocallimastix californiae]